MTIEINENSQERRGEGESEIENFSHDRVIINI
jgi:hypothetical protein